LIAAGSVRMLNKPAPRAAPAIAGEGRMAEQPKRMAWDLTWREILKQMQGSPNADRFLQAWRSRVAEHVNRRLSERELLLLLGLGGQVLQLLWPVTRQRLEKAFGATLESLQADAALRARTLGLDADRFAEGEAMARSGFRIVMDQKAREARISLETFDLVKQAEATALLRDRVNGLPASDLAVLLYVRDDARALLTPRSLAAVAAIFDLRHLDFLSFHEQLPGVLGMTRAQFRAAAGRLAAWWWHAIEEIAAAIGAHPLGDPNREH
jgi:hypothetical protein